MAEILAIVKLLEEKCRLFLSFEQVTEDMLTCPTDELEQHIHERDKLIHLIDTIDAQTESALLLDERAGLIMRALRGEENRGELDEDIGAIYDASAAVRAVVARIPEAEIQVGLRLRQEQERLLELIKSTNRGVEAQAARFSAGTDTTGGHITDA